MTKVQRRWSDVCVVAASGPSLDRETAERCRGVPTIAVNDAYRMLPFADVLYACDGKWWDHHHSDPLLAPGMRAFAGEKWSSHGGEQHNNKLAAAEKYGLRLVNGKAAAGFSTYAGAIHYGDNSGFQAVNLAGHMLGWRGRAVLVGFDMRTAGNRAHFFGDHPKTLKTTRETTFRDWCNHFARAARKLPDGFEIVNCTPGSVLKCFPSMPLEQALPRSAAQRIEDERDRDVGAQAGL